jgi:hypothetical protein
MHFCPAVEVFIFEITGWVFTKISKEYIVWFVTVQPGAVPHKGAKARAPLENFEALN